MLGNILLLQTIPITVVKVLTLDKLFCPVGAAAPVRLQRRAFNFLSKNFLSQENEIDYANSEQQLT